MTFNSQFDLDETCRSIRDTVRDFAEKMIAPQAEAIDKTNCFPRELWPEMGKLGLLGVTVEEKYGGSELNYLSHVIAMEEISRASAAVGLSYGAHSNLCVNQIRLNGTDEQKKKFLPKLCSGEHIGALAMSETLAGSDVMNLQLRAEEISTGYCLNGNKMWITNGPDADVLVVYARTKKDAGSKGITAFIVEKSMPGFFSAQKLDKLGMRGSNTSELVFENCEIPSTHILGKVDQGAKVLMKGLDIERLILSAGPIGIMQACLDVVLPYIHSRVQFGKPIGEFQLMQAKVADMYVALNSARAYTYSMAKAADNQLLTRTDAAAAILYASEKAVWVASQAIQALGGNGYINEFPTGRFLRDAKLYEIGAGTSEIRRILIGRELYEGSI